MSHLADYMFQNNRCIRARLSTVGVCMIISICLGTRGLPPFCPLPWAERGQFFSVRPGFTQRVVTTPGEQSWVKLLVAFLELLLSQGLASWVSCLAVGLGGSAHMRIVNEALCPCRVRVTVAHIYPRRESVNPGVGPPVNPSRRISSAPHLLSTPQHMFPSWSKPNKEMCQALTFEFQICILKARLKR